MDLHHESNSLLIDLKWLQLSESNDHAEATDRLTIINGLIFIMLDVKLNVCDRWKTGDEKQNGDGEPVRSGSSQTPSLLAVVGTKHPYTPTLQT